MTDNHNQITLRSHTVYSAKGPSYLAARLRATCHPSYFHYNISPETGDGHAMSPKTGRVAVARTANRSYSMLRSKAGMITMSSLRMKIPTRRLMLSVRPQQMPSCGSLMCVCVCGVPQMFRSSLKHAHCSNTKRGRRSESMVYWEGEKEDEMLKKNTLRNGGKRQK